MPTTTRPRPRAIVAAAIGLGLGHVGLANAAPRRPVIVGTGLAAAVGDVERLAAVGGPGVTVSIESLLPPLPPERGSNTELDVSPEFIVAWLGGDVAGHGLLAVGLRGGIQESRRGWLSTRGTVYLAGRVGIVMAGGPVVTSLVLGVVGSPGVSPLRAGFELGVLGLHDDGAHAFGPTGSVVLGVAL
jgi:hypothetical protein